MVAKTHEISEAKIRQALWMQKANKTKKSICEHLGIAYNTKRLDTILKEFKEKEERIALLKKRAKTKVFSKEEKLSIAADYQEGNSINAIATRNFISSQKVKSFLLEMGVPIRSRKKRAPAQTEHVIQDLDVKFQKGEKVFHAPSNCFAVVTEVLDEEYLEYLVAGIQKYVELRPFDPYNNKGYLEPVYDVHYMIYWILEDGRMWKLEQLKEHRKNVETHIEEYGRESYNICTLDDFSHKKIFVPREQLFPVVKR